MEQERIHDRAKLRALLLDSEQSRSDTRRRELFWEGGTRWQHCLDQLAQREHASDAEFQHEIDEARRGSETQIQLEAQWFANLEDDLAWYTQLLATLHRTENNWQNARSVSQQAQQELTNQIGQIAWRMLERRSIYHQLGIDMLERRRQRRGEINGKHWREHWDTLQSTFRQQDDAFGDTIPSSVIEQRLAWAQRVYELQQETEQSWQQQTNVDWRGLRADMVTVANFINRLSPQPAGFGGVGVFAGIVVVIAVVIGIGGAIGKANTGSIASNVSAPLPAPTGAAIQAAAMPVGDQKTLNQRGVDMLKQGRYDEAIAQFQTAYIADPTAYSAYEPLNNMAFCLYELARLEEATAKWRQALGIEPNSPDANAGLGLALYVAGQQDEGLNFYRKAVALQAGYLDEAYLRDTVFWSAHAIEASRPLREAIK